MAAPSPPPTNSPLPSTDATFGARHLKCCLCVSLPLTITIDTTIIGTHTILRPPHMYRTTAEKERDARARCCENPPHFSIKGKEEV